MVPVVDASGGGGAATGGGRLRSEGGSGSGVTKEQPASPPRIAAAVHARPRLRIIDMWVILLEALGAVVALLFIVWWTMFSGRRKGERREPGDADR
jgi:hypothetical protein